MSILLDVYKRLLADIELLSGVSLLSDAPSVMTNEWVLIEGPKLDKDVLHYLEHGGVIPTFPEWLIPLWDKFIITNDALMLKYLRTCLCFCYKAEYEPTQVQLEEAQASFVETDAMIGIWDTAFEQGQISVPFMRYMRQYVGRVIARANFSEIIPAHGPGSVFPSRPPVSKSRFLTVYSDIQQYYPYDQFFCGLPSFWWQVMVEEAMGSIVECDSVVARLVAVPKDSRGPRLICVHPAEAIWIQQGQRRVLERAIESSYLTRNRINFRDQSVNGSLALASSSSREFCTLDLKDASDRISHKLVRYLFGYTANLLSCSRARSVLLMDGRILPLLKFAPMGNAITFPVESLIFWSAVRAGIACHYGETCDDIYVFGDDVLFPSKYYDGAILGLTRIGAITNAGKTFRKGLFRESCGVDAFNGIDVTPHRIRVQDISSVPNAISICALAKALRMDGYEHTSSYLYTQVRRRWGSLPLSNNPNAQGLFEYIGSASSVFRYGKVRFNPNYQIWESQIRLVRGTFIRPSQHDWYHVQDAILSLERATDVYFRGAHEDGYPVPYRERLTYGWTEIL